MKWICIWLIRLYQRCISPLKRTPTCRFTPTCSAYAVEAFRKRGFFVGFVLTVSRIARCHPFCAGGYDPVPEHGLTNKKTRETSDNEARSEDRPKVICEDYVLRRSRRQSKTTGERQSSKDNAD